MVQKQKTTSLQVLMNDVNLDPKGNEDLPEGVSVPQCSSAETLCSENTVVECVNACVQASALVSADDHKGNIELTEENLKIYTPMPENMFLPNNTTDSTDACSPKTESLAEKRYIESWSPKYVVCVEETWNGHTTDTLREDLFDTLLRQKVKYNELQELFFTGRYENEQKEFEHMETLESPQDELRQAKGKSSKGTSLVKDHAVLKAELGTVLLDLEAV